jgi:uncharacterized protein (TIGR03086 family)
MAPSDELTYQVDTLRSLIAGVRPDQMSAPTPCANWNVRQLINHFVTGAPMFAAAFRGEDVQIDPDAPAPDMVGDDPLASFDASIADFRDAVDAPGAMEKVVNLPFGAIPAPFVLELLKFDLLVHCWDLSQATGQPFDPPADLANHGLEVAKQMIAAENRNGDTFADEVTVGANATPIEKLVAYTGRKP